MQQTDNSRWLVRAMAWSGVGLVVSLVISQGFLMGFIPPPSPALSADELAAIFIERKIGIRVGTLIQCIFYTCYLTWAMSIVMQMRKMESGRPVMTYVSIANVGGGYVFFLLMPIFWAALAFRPEEMDPAFLQIMNDLVWFVFILSWPPFAVFMVCLAIAIFRDRNVPTIYPRWVAYFNLWCAVLISPAALIEFFKTGPFAYNGVISFWLIYIVFFGWIVVMSVLTLRAEERTVSEPAHARGEAALNRA